MRVEVTGLEELGLSLEEVADIPDDVVMEMLAAGGEVVKAYHQAELSAQGLVDTGKLKDSITVHQKRGGSGRYALVYPSGKHGDYHRKLQVKPYKRSKHGRTYTVGGDTKEVTNNDVGFVLEVGAPKRGLAPTQWMRLANEKSSEAMVAAERAVYERYLARKGL